MCKCDTIVEAQTPMSHLFFLSGLPVDAGTADHD